MFSPPQQGGVGAGCVVIQLPHFELPSILSRRPASACLPHQHNEAARQPDQARALEDQQSRRSPPRAGFDFDKVGNAEQDKEQCHRARDAPCADECAAISERHDNCAGQPEPGFTGVENSLDHDIAEAELVRALAVRAIEH